MPNTRFHPARQPLPEQAKSLVPVNFFLFTGVLDAPAQRPARIVRSTFYNTRHYRLTAVFKPISTVL